MKQFHLIPILALLLLSAPGCFEPPADSGDQGARGPLGKADATGQCQADDGTDYCGSKSDGACWCDESCVLYGDCCADRDPVCYPEESPVSWLAQGRSVWSVDDFVAGDDGSIGMVGAFSNTATFGSKTLTSIGLGDGYVARLNSEGNFTWAAKLGTPNGHDSMQRLAMHGDETVVLGQFDADADWGQTNVFRDDHFLLHYDAEGQIDWSRRLGRMGKQVKGEIYSTDLVVQSDGTVVVFGSYTGRVDVGAGVPIVDSKGASGFFLARYDAAGVYLDVKTYAPVRPTYFHRGDLSSGQLLLTKDDEVILVANAKYGDFDFGTSEILKPRYDLLLVGFDAELNTKWAKVYGGKKTDEVVLGASLDSLGNVLVTGYWIGLEEKDERCSPWVVNEFVSNMGGDDMKSIFCGRRAFAASYDGTDGDHQWSTTLKTYTSDNYLGVDIVEHEGAIMILGSFNGKLGLGGESVINSHGYDAEDYDSFTARFDNSGTLLGGEFLPGLYRKSPSGSASRHLEVSGATRLMALGFVFDLETPAGTASYQPGGGGDIAVVAW